MFRGTLEYMFRYILNEIPRIINLFLRKKSCYAVVVIDTASFFFNNINTKIAQFGISKS